MPEINMLSWLQSLTAINIILLCVSFFLLVLNLMQLVQRLPWVQHRFGFHVVSKDGFPIKLVDKAKLLVGSEFCTYCWSLRIQIGSESSGLWGSPLSDSFVDQNSAPRSVSIEWASLCEESFYRGEFPIPKKTLRKSINYFFWRPSLRVRNDKKKYSYVHYVIGIRPGGVVDFWVQGRTDSVTHKAEIFPLATFQAKAFQPNLECDHECYFSDLKQKLPDADREQLQKAQAMFPGGGFDSLESFLQHVAEAPDPESAAGVFLVNFKKSDQLLNELESIQFSIDGLESAILAVLYDFLLKALRDEDKAKAGKVISLYFYWLSAKHPSDFYGQLMEKFFADGLVTVIKKLVDDDLGSKLFETILEKKLHNRRLSFNLACYYALKKDKKQLLHYAQQASEQGTKAEDFLGDPDFTEFKHDKEFIAAIRK